MSGLIELARLIDSSCSKANQALMNWAAGPDNSGPFQDEAYRTCVHVAASNRLLCSEISSALRAHASTPNKGDQNDG